jgi:hypothetical protein
VRIRSGRLLAGLVVLGAAWGCYSSVAPVPKIDRLESDSGVDIEPPPPDACTPRRPWEGPGVTGVLPMSDSMALVLSGDRYFAADFETSGGDAGDPTLGRPLAWRESGLLRDLWFDAPPAVGRAPWDDPGVTAVYITKAEGAKVIISGFRRWVYDRDNWAAAGTVVDDWLIADAGPPPVDGQAPWEGPGVTATYYTPTRNFFYVISGGRAWMRRTFDEDPNNWTWADAGYNLVDSPAWSSAPAVGGQRPWEGKGVTAAYYLGPKLFVMSVDRMWVRNGSSSEWLESGMIAEMPGWSSAPAAGCEG